ncbi:MAG: histidine kinase [Clostridia bacterium]|nr:histidine kinase [Clostridia bacterium]
MDMNSIKKKVSKHSNLIRFLINVLIWALIISIALTIGYFSRLTFHTIAELFTIIVAFSAFIIVLNTFTISQNSYLTFLGIGFGFVSIFEIIHVLTYAGTDIFMLNNANIYSLAAVLPRLFQSVIILVSFLFINKKIKIALSVTTYCLISIILLSGILFFGNSIGAFIDHVGFLVLYKSLEITAAMLFLVALIALIINRKKMKFRIFKYMLFSLLASVMADALLVIDANMNSMVNVSSHILKFIAFFCIYKAVIQNTLRNPVDSMFFELDMVKNELAEKNYEVSKNNELLKHDIDDLHAVEKLLRKSKAWSRSIFEGSTVGIALLNTNSVVIEVNPALERILGYSANEIKNIGISNITHIEDIENDSRLFDDLIEGTIDSYKIEKRYIRKDNKVIWANAMLSYIQNVGEDFQFIIAMIEDITQQKENEERQQQLVARLEETNKELDNFAYIVSHDLKAPLRGIGSLANWLLADYKDKLDEEGADIINLLVNRVERMKNFIDGILQYSRVTRVKENYVEIHMDKLIKDVIELLAPPENIKIIVNSEMPIIMGEVIYIEQIYQNLISNAIKFMDKPQGEIIISCRSKEDLWEFSVSDNGTGIDEKYFNKIFMIFQTLQPRDKFESTGIGLSIVKKIVETSGGKIWLESKLTKGTTFYFTLPKNA